MDYHKLGDRIREERKKLNLSQTKLSEKIGVSDTYLGAIERGEKSLTLDTLEKISKVFGVSIDYLLSDSIESTDQNIIDQFRRIIYGQSSARKQMAIDILKTLFNHLNKEEN